MRRYMVDSSGEDNMAFKSSQSLRQSEHSSPQLENSQSSSFDIYSQMMSQQQGFNSQPSEAPHIAQKYYTKFSSKPSLFKGKDVIALEKPGLTRRRSFQDINEFQKQRARDKEDRDLICTLVSLLKEGTDDIHQTAEKIKSELEHQVAEASAKLEDAFKMVQNFLQDFKSEFSCNMNDKLESKQSNEELKSKLKEKEAIVQTLREELVQTKDMKLEAFKNTVTDMCSVQQKDILSELKLQKDSCDAHYTEQKEFFRALGKDLEAYVEDTIKTQLKKTVEECSKELIKKGVNEQRGDSSNSLSTVPADPSVSKVQTTFTTSQTNPDCMLTTQHFENPHTAAELPKIFNSIECEHFLVSSGDGIVPNEEATTFQQFGSNRPQPETSRCVASDRRYGYHNFNEFSSPPFHPVSKTRASSQFSRWTSKGPSPVAAVAPIVHESVVKEKRYTTEKRHDNGLRKVRHNYQPIRRQSARLKQKNINKKVLPRQSVNLQEKRVWSPGFDDKYVAKGASKSKVLRNVGQLQMTRRDKVWEMNDLYRHQEVSQFPSAKLHNQRNYLSQLQSNKSDNSVVYGELHKRQRQDYSSSSQKRNKVFTDKGFMADVRNEADYKSESDQSSPETALFSVVMQDPGSQELFIDAIDDQMYTSDEDCEMRNTYEYTTSPAHLKQMDTRSRPIKKKRTLWSTESTQNRDLLSFLTSSIKRRANLV